MNGQCDPRTNTNEHEGTRFKVFELFTVSYDFVNRLPVCRTTILARLSQLSSHAAEERPKE